MSYSIHLSRLMDPHHKFKCEKCLDTGNEGDIGFFIRCTNGCKDTHHEMLEMDKWLDIARQNRLRPCLLDGELVIRTGFMPSPQLSEDHE